MDVRMCIRTLFLFAFLLSEAILSLLYLLIHTFTKYILLTSWMTCVQLEGGYL
jgi:hypothetical protein